MTGMRLEADKWRFPVAVTFLYFLMGFFFIFLHEPWRDEQQAWLLARESTSFTELLSHLKYEGHPPIWHLCLMVITRIWNNPFGMQVFHLLLATGTTFCVVSYSPFSRLQNWLFVFGYFSVFEYSLIARNYAIAVLIIVIVSSLSRRRFEWFGLIAVLLGILCQACVHGAIIAIAFYTSLMAEYLLRRTRGLDFERLPTHQLVVGSVLFFAALGASFLQMLPPSDSGFMTEWHTSFDLKRAEIALGGVARSYLPLPVLRRDFWNSNFTELLPWSRSIQAAIACGFLYCSSRVLLKSTLSVILFLLGTIGLVVFAYAKHSGGMRHDGFLFIVWFVSIWVAKSLDDDGQSLELSEHASEYALSWERSSKFLTALLFVHFAGGLAALVQEYRYEFSGGRHAANIIARSDLQDSTFLVCEPDYIAPAILPYLSRPSATFLRGNRSGSFIVWDRARLAGEPDSIREILRRVTALADDALLATNSTIDVADSSEWKLDFLGESNVSIVPDEQIFIYRIRRLSGSGWQFGFGELNVQKSQLLRFEPFSYYENDCWFASKDHEDLLLGYCILSRVGGHPGGDLQHCCIRRWVANEDCSIRVSGKVTHLQPRGDGIDAHLFIAGKAIQSVHAINESREFASDWLEIKFRDTVDFVVDCCEDLFYDQFDSRITIEQRVKDENIRNWISDEESMLGNREQFSGGWHYGWGEINELRTELNYFARFKNYQNETWCGKSGIPDSEIGWCTLTRMGGHPGGDRKHCCIRRWVAGSDSEIRISGKLIHTQIGGDGVNGHVFHLKKAIKSVHAHNNSKPVSVDWLHVKSGDFVDFVTDCVDNEQFDQFDWKISIEQKIGKRIVQVWESDTQFWREY